MDQADHYHSPYHPISAVPYYRVGAPVKDHHHHHHHHHQTVESAAQAAAVQSRILEMRKEKSRDAARSRRGKENHEFYELAKLLPLPAAITSQLDKASIIRLTISYLKLRDFTLNGDPTWSLSSSPLKSSKLCKQNHVFDVHQGTHILQSLDGFAFALGSDGRFLYISETVSIYLGLSQVEMTGSSLFDYVHQQDHTELAEVLGITSSHGGTASSSSHMAHSPLPPASVASNASSESESTPFSNPGTSMTLTGPNDTFERQFCIRMKSTLTKRGCQHFKSSGYRVVHVISHLRLESAQQRRSDSNGSTPRVIGLVALAIALPPPSVNELRLESDMFVLRLGLDLKILHVEPRVTELLDFTPEELVGKSMYSFVHGQDAVQIRKCHVDLLHKGQVMSKYFRFMKKNGGHSWIQSCATLINNSSNNSNNSNSPVTSKSPTGSNCGSSKNTTDEQDQCIICINYIISGHEEENIISDCTQLPGNSLVESPATSSPSGVKQRPPSKAMRPLSPASSAPSPGLARNRSKNSIVEECEAASPVGSDCKRRRYTSSPVRPWKTPSPAVEQATAGVTASVGTGPPGAGSGGGGGGGGGGHGSPHTTPASNLLRHISVIRETPIGFHRPPDTSILKPQVVTAPYHAHPAHHYHHLVDPYAAAYHLYKNGSGTGAPMTGATAPASAGHSHPWGYN